MRILSSVGCSHSHCPGLNEHVLGRWCNQSASANYQNLKVTCIGPIGIIGYLHHLHPLQDKLDKDIEVIEASVFLVLIQGKRRRAW